ncbi:inositol monophosphatase (plasmid) [Rhizobium sullae]|uniref:Inositol monophosphatase n=1 Tax=Rhizobium sullae TaxID=50338 RepID=A0ABY5XXH5_RHISU|nr:inositol monophosphatase [Rhizobium sullae]UWU19323.1 inositol monophosphatase [Rhizobium sullae]
MTLTRRDLATVADVLRNVSAGIVLPRFGQTNVVRQKSSRLDLVSEVDELAEEAIRSSFATAFPGALIIGEEDCGTAPELMFSRYQSGRMIVIDPIDGTKNFTSGLSVFGMMVAIADEREISGGVIFDPISNEVSMALRGEGAWTEYPDGTQETHHTAPGRDVSDMVGLASWMFFKEPHRSRVLAGLAATAGAADYRCAAHHHRLLLKGHYDFALFSKLTPWDQAAGWLMHREAGGYSARLDGLPFRPTDTEGGILFAPDEASWHALHSALVAQPSDR